MAKPTKVKKPYRPKKYETQQLVWADEVQYLGNDLFLSDNLFPLLNRWKIQNKVIPTIIIPIRYSPEKRRFEFIKKATYTLTGALKVADIGSGLEHNDTKTGTTTNVWSSPITFDEIVSVVDVEVWGNDLDFQRSYDGVSYDDVIKIPAGATRSYPVVTTSFKVKSSELDKPAEYQIVGWW